MYVVGSLASAEEERNKDRKMDSFCIDVNIKFTGGGGDRRGYLLINTSGFYYTTLKTVSSAVQSTADHMRCSLGFPEWQGSEHASWWLAEMVPTHRVKLTMVRRL